MFDYYAILGVNRNATPNEIRDAYLRLARDTHPDKVKDPEARKQAENLFKNVTAAYDTLSRDRTRREYSAKLGDAPVLTHQTQKNPSPLVQGPSLPPRDSSTPTAPANQSPAIPTPSGRVSFDALAQGIEAFKKQDFHTAVQLLNMSVNLDPGSARAHGVLSLALAKNPNWVRDALNHMETASRLDPKNVSYLSELALMLHSQGLKLRAKRALETAVGLNAEHADVLRALKEIPLAPPDEGIASQTAENARGLFDRLRKR